MIESNMPDILQPFPKIQQHELTLPKLLNQNIEIVHCSFNSYIIAVKHIKVKFCFYKNGEFDKPYYSITEPVSHIVINVVNTIAVIFGRVAEKNNKYVFILWDLVTGLTRKYQLLHDIALRPELIMFKQSQLFCVLEKKSVNDKKKPNIWIFKLVQNKIITIFTLIDKKKIKMEAVGCCSAKINSFMKIFKVNEVSKIATFDAYQMQRVSKFKVYDLMEILNSNSFVPDIQGNQYQFFHGIESPFTMPSHQIQQIWQISQNSFYLQFYTKDSSQKDTQRIQTDFIWNFKQGKIKRLSYPNTNSIFQIQFFNNQRETTKKYIQIDEDLLSNKIYDLNFKQRNKGEKTIYLVTYFEERDIIVGKIQTNQIKTKSLFLNDKCIEQRQQLQERHPEILRIATIQCKDPPLTRTIAVAFLMTELIQNCEDDLLAYSIDLL